MKRVRLGPEIISAVVTRFFWPPLHPTIASQHYKIRYNNDVHSFERLHSSVAEDDTEAICNFRQGLGHCHSCCQQPAHHGHQELVDASPDSSDHLASHLQGR